MLGLMDDLGILAAWSKCLIMTTLDERICLDNRDNPGVR